MEFCLFFFHDEKLFLFYHIVFRFGYFAIKHKQTMETFLKIKLNIFLGRNILILKDFYSEEYKFGFFLRSNERMRLGNMERDRVSLRERERERERETGRYR